MAEEYVDAGVWRENGWLYRWTKRLERRLVRRADGIVVLTEKARALLAQWYGDDVHGKPLEVIPCCVDLRGGVEAEAPRCRPRRDAHLRVRRKAGRLVSHRADGAVHVGQRAAVARARWQVWTQSDAGPLKRLLQQQGIEQRVQIGQIAAERLPAELRRAHAGLAFIKPCRSKIASSPTKVGEYLAAGLPVIANAGIGDLDAPAERAGDDGAVGVLVEPFDAGGGWSKEFAASSSS